MAAYTQVTTAVTGNTITAAIWNNEFVAVGNSLNSISNAQIASDAAIALSKLASLPATVTGTETLTNKTLTSPIINTPLMKGSYEAWVTDTDGTTVTFDLATGNKHRVTLGGNRTLALSNVQNGHAFAIKLTQDGTGSRLATWFSTITWPDGVVPTLTTTASKSDCFGFIQTGSGAYDGVIIYQNL